MPENLTDSPTFDTPVSVPVGTDPGTQRSELLKVAFQALANRSAFLKAITDFAVRNNIGNVMTQPSDIVAPIEMSTLPTTQYALRLAFNSGSTRKARIYTSTFITSTIIITNNARWIQGSSQWRQDDASAASSMIQIAGIRMQTGAKSAGAADWGPTAWDTLTSLGGAAGLTAAAAAISGDFSTGQVVSNLTLASGFEVLYASPNPLRSPSMLLSDLVGVLGTVAYSDSPQPGWQLSNSGTPAEALVPVRMPQGAQFQGLDIILSQSAAAAMQLTLERVNTNFATGVTTVTTISASNSPTTAQHVFTLAPSGNPLLDTINNIGAHYQLRLNVNVNPNTARVLGFQARFRTVGPSSV